MCCWRNGSIKTAKMRRRVSLLFLCSEEDFPLKISNSLRKKSHAYFFLPQILKLLRKILRINFFPYEIQSYHQKEPVRANKGTGYKGGKTK